MHKRFAAASVIFANFLAACTTTSPAAPSASLAEAELPRAHQPKVELTREAEAPAPGKVLITRTQEAVPPPTQEEVSEQIQKQTAAAIEQAKKQALEDLNTKFTSLAGQTSLLLDQTSAVLKSNVISQEALNSQLATQRQALVQTKAQLTENLNTQVSSTLAQIRADQQEALQPEKIRSIAEQTVADAAPQFQALALQSVRNSEDYIRTVARTAVADNDPAIAEALAKAASNVITKDDRIVFAIRKVVASELEEARLNSSVTANIAAAENLTGVDNPQLSAADLANIEPASGAAPQAQTVRNRADWVDIREYKVVVHQDGRTLEELLGSVVTQAEPFVGPWQIKWKISDENKDVLQERFSLDVEASFAEFVSYLAQYLVNDRGIKISFSLFDSERIIVVSD